MYRDGEGVFVDIGKAIHHFEILVKYNQDAAHWNLACIYESEEGYVSEKCAGYYFQLAADLENKEASEVLVEYFVSGTGPRYFELAYGGELKVFLRKIETLYSRRKSATPNVYYANIALRRVNRYWRRHTSSRGVLSFGIGVFSEHHHPQEGLQFSTIPCPSRQGFDGSPRTCCTSCYLYIDSAALLYVRNGHIYLLVERIFSGLHLG